MTLSEYKEQVGRIPFGKRLPTAVYVHRGGVAAVGGSLGAVLDQVVARYGVSEEFNVVKFRTDELKVSFLAYPDFDSDPHPALKHAITIDLATGKARHTDYEGRMAGGELKLALGTEIPSSPTEGRTSTRWTFCHPQVFKEPVLQGGSGSAPGRRFGLGPRYRRSEVFRPA